MSGNLPSDLTSLDSAELRQWDHGTAALGVQTCLVGSTPGVTVTSQHDVTMTSHDVVMTSIDDKVASQVRDNVRLFI